MTVVILKIDSISLFLPYKITIKSKNMSGKRLVRSQNQVIAGVAGGVANYLGVDPTVVRIIWLICLLAYGTGLLIYLIFWLLMPSR